MQSWLVQLDNAVLGPMTLQELRQLAQLGGLRPETRVSATGQKWQAASTLPELTFAGAASPSRSPLPPPPRPSTSKSSHLTMLMVGGGVVIGILGLLSILTCGFLALFLPTSGAQPAPGTNPSESSAPVESFVEVPLEQPVIDPVPQATYDYWESLARSMKEIPSAKTVNAQEENLRGLIGDLERQAVVNVDPAATECALQLSLALRKLLAVIVNSQDPSVLAEAMIRGALGDPLGKSQEIVAETRNAQQEINAALQHSVRVRAQLSRRYGVEFSPWYR